MEFITIKFLNDPQGIHYKNVAAAQLSREGWKLVSEQIQPGQFRGGRACCAGTMCCLPAMALAGNTPSVIVATFAREQIPAGIPYQTPEQVQNRFQPQTQLSGVKSQWDAASPSERKVILIIAGVILLMVLLFLAYLSATGPSTSPGTSATTSTETSPEVMQQLKDALNILSSVQADAMNHRRPKHTLKEADHLIHESEVAGNEKQNQIASLLRAYESAIDNCIAERNPRFSKREIACWRNADQYGNAAKSAFPTDALARVKIPSPDKPLTAAVRGRQNYATLLQLTYKNEGRLIQVEATGKESKILTLTSALLSEGSYTEQAALRETVDCDECMQRMRKLGFTEVDIGGGSYSKRIPLR